MTLRRLRCLREPRGGIEVWETEQRIQSDGGSGTGQGDPGQADGGLSSERRRRTLAESMLRRATHAEHPRRRLH